MIDYKREHLFASSAKRGFTVKKTFQTLIAKQTLNRVREPRMPFDWSINPYRGCAHGCAFCYARATHKFLDKRADDSFQNHIFIKTNAAEALESQLSQVAKRFKGNLDAVARHFGVVAIGTATDPYQSVEGKAKVTRECLKVLSKFRIPITITTRSPLILRDLDVLNGMRIASIQISIGTLDADVCRRMEPGASRPQKRLEIVNELSQNGLPAGIFMAPILPYLTDSAAEIERLIAAAKGHQATFVSASVLRLIPEVKAWYFKTLKQHYPDLFPAYVKLYRNAYPHSAYVNTVMEKIDVLLKKYQLPSSLPERYQWDKDLPSFESKGEQLAFDF